MPNQPYLDHKKTKVDGLAFLGLSLTRNSVHGHPDSITHQTAFDLNEVLDRDYEFLMSSNDDGWLVGGGEPGPPTSYKLAAKDSSHVEIMRIGTYRPEWGGIKEKDIIKAIKSGKILIPQIEVVPTGVIANPDTPPELEIRFDMEPPVPNFKDPSVPLPVNWELRFIHNQLFKFFQFPSRFCPGPFHSTILRKADFRSDKHREAYFAKCDAAIKKWKLKGPQPLNTGAWDIDGSGIENPGKYNSGIWLFADRENITRFFKPNFLPPYDDPEKRKVILDFLREEWDEKTLSWKPVREIPELKEEDNAEREEESAMGIAAIGDSLANLCGVE
eukprot:CAMPEP_0183308452 /NCGR_PEP_ID=MMETSP0160_2-20130417/22058_1 /TAXON_ID=2839 ORGANISM="Odontella Sinensis, Strain Grunow 1884" /NCGR_SAMPLE_ID=MMETSP0160_2 /ASSEMBLY_ACC=CAM_ASM_000250 /LENGTH=329 /DNA_ID=CAMNT_0025472293 /DNA_START=72 /DNA_END=1061 /DNA_ORIENTATION=-